MSMMAETSQSAMGPYAAEASVVLALNAWTALLRDPLLMKALAWRRRLAGGWVPARSTGSHCRGHATPLIGSDGYRCDEACPVTSSECKLGSETGSMLSTDAVHAIRRHHALSLHIRSGVLTCCRRLCCRPRG